MKNKFLTLFLAAILTLSLAACGNQINSNFYGEGSSQTEEDAKASEGGTGAVRSEAKDGKDAQLDTHLIEEALKNLNAASSMEAQVVMEMDMIIGAGGQTQTLETVTKTNMICFYEPTLRIKMDMNMVELDINMDKKSLSTQNMTMYADTMEDRSIMTYQYDGKKWKSEAAGAMDLEAYDARRNMSTYVKEGILYKEEGMEKVNGANAYKYSYTMTGEEMKEAMLNLGFPDAASSLGINENQLEGMMDNLGEMVVHVWVDEETLYPVKYEMDMTEIMDKLMSNMVEVMGERVAGLSMSISKATTSMTCSHFNDATDFNIPDEARHTN